MKNTRISMTALIMAVFPLLIFGVTSIMNIHLFGVGQRIVASANTVLIVAAFGLSIYDMKKEHRKLVNLASMVPVINRFTTSSDNPSSEIS